MVNENYRFKYVLQRTSEQHTAKASFYALMNGNNLFLMNLFRRSAYKATKETTNREGKQRKRRKASENGV